MSQIAEQATVAITFADFGNVDSTGKINIVGGGVAVSGFDPGAGLTSRFSLWVQIWLPAVLTPAEFAVEVALVDPAGTLVMVPGPSGAQPIRIAQVVTAEKPTVQLASSIKDHIGSRLNLMFEFGSGIPLAPGANYVWRVMIDGDEARVWEYPWSVAGPPPGPVIG
ncbi:MAG: hypothetical protein KF727_06455 [Microbacteriaceae bacterium]|nr:hypothetical protein [Microbacteriaceae bacterium]